MADADYEVLVVGEANADLELETLTVARLGQPTEVAGEWRPSLPSTPTRCSGGQGSFPSRAPKEGSQRGAVTTLCTWRRSCSCCRAAQQEKPAELAGREPSAGGGGYGRLARLGAARAHGEAAWGAANVLLGSISTFTSQPLVARAHMAIRIRDSLVLSLSHAPTAVFSYLVLLIPRS